MKIQIAHVTAFAFLLAFQISAIETRMPVDAIHAPGSNHTEFVISRPGVYYFPTNLIVAMGPELRLPPRMSFWT